PGQFGLHGIWTNKAMSYISLSEADRLHHLAAARTIRYHRVDHPLLRSFDSLSRGFIRRLGDAAQDDRWYPFVRMVARYRRALIGSPLAFNDPAIEPVMSLTDTE